MGRFPATPPTTSERGSALLLGAAVVVLCAALVLGVARLGPAAGARAGADAVADVVALAGVSGGRDAALRVAGANGAELTGFVDGVPGGGVVEVRIRRDGVESVAAAAGAVPDAAPGAG